MTEEIDHLDIFRAMCATAWVMFFLIMKNLVLLVILAIQRKKNAAFRIPEDAERFAGGQVASDNTGDWSLAGRIQRILANDTEYVPYFLVLLIVLFCTITLTAQAQHHYLSRVLVYGITFTIARYLHTIGYLCKNSYIRILGFLITVVILFVLLLDHVYYMTKRVHNYKP